MTDINLDEPATLLRAVGYCKTPNGKVPSFAIMSEGTVRSTLEFYRSLKSEWVRSMSRMLTHRGVIVDGDAIGLIE